MTDELTQLPDGWRPAKVKRTAWNAGTSKGWSDKRGYRWIYVVENGKRRAKREHRHIMEKHIGRRLLPEEVVHHINGDPSDNRIENLEIKAFGTHTSEHHRGTKKTEQTRITMAVFAEYREEVKRLHALNADLLAACVQAYGDLIEGREVDIEKLDRAIAKAEGRS